MNKATKNNVTKRVEAWLEDYNITDLMEADQHLGNYVTLGRMTMKPSIVGLWACAAGNTNDADVVKENVKLAWEIVKEHLKNSEATAALNGEAALYEIRYNL